MRNLCILFIVFLLSSCNSVLDKSIFVPLTVEELKSSIEKDSLFEGTYAYILYVRDSVMKSDLEKVKYADLTYAQIQEYLLFSTDTTYFNPKYERFEKEWNEKFGIYRDQVDSVSNYWKKLIEDNSIEQYIKIELVKIDKEYYSYDNDVRSVNLGFRLTPLKGKIEQVVFGYSIEAKINEKEKDDIYSSILDKSWCRATSPFSSPIVRYWEADYTNENILKYKSLKTFLRDYNIHIEVDKIRKDGINMSVDDLDIPQALKSHWKYENNESFPDLYFGDVVKEVLNEEYLEEYEYFGKEKDKILKEKFPLVFEFSGLRY
jgi:hypothetical protein